jgi:ribosomal protein S27AE
VNHLHPHDDSHAYRFCPRCGGALERRLLKASEPERPVCTQCGFVFYIDPKIAVGTIIETEGGRLVLVRRAIEPGYGRWVFPGGYVDRGEPLTAAAVREARVDDECLESAEFERSQIPWDRLAFRSTHDGLRDYLGGARHSIPS